jgi:hypothetical protein
MNLIKTMGMVLLLLAAPGLILAEGLVAAPPDPNDLYQGALQAYLSGDFDQAILLDSKALQINPGFQKAQGLLSILISEKDTARKTVIWIGGKPPTITEAPPVAPLAPVTVLKERVVNNNRSAAGDAQKMKELETRVQTVAFLLERDSFNQYRELTGAQVQTTKRLEEISSGLKDVGRGQTQGNFLFLLALIIACFALWNSWNTRRELKKQKRNSDRSDDSGENRRVVNLR